MRFCLQLAARYCSISAITLSMLFSNSVDGACAAQVGYGYNTTQYGAYGSPAATSPPQSFATSRPFQADSPGSNYQSMSPDSWGNSSPSGAADPFSAAPSYSRPSRLGPSSFAYGQPPAQDPTVQNSNPSYAHGPATAYPPAFTPATAPAYKYESTGAPSVKDLVGGQAAPSAPPSDRSAPPSPFRPAEFDTQDPRDIPLAPTVPASILDANDNRLDLPPQTTTPNAVDPSSTEQGPVELEPQLQPPVAPQSTVGEDVSPTAPLNKDVVEGNVEVPPPPTPTATPQTLGQTSNSFSASPEIQYPQTTAPPIAPLVQAPDTPYQLPRVFEQVPTNATVSAPATVGPQDQLGSGFGWGNAPGVFKRVRQASPTQQPQPVLQPQQGTGPSFPLPFGLGSRLGSKSFGQRFGLNKSQPDFSQPQFAVPAPSDKKRPFSFGGKKQVDPNTYPPQPISPSQTDIGAPRAFPAQPPNAQFRPDLGQRTPLPTVRNPGTYDSGQAEYEFENKKREFPPFSEILATGRWFGSVEAQFVQPRFNGTSGITTVDQTTGNNFVNSQVFDFDFEFLPSLRLGFESKYGPGFEFDYRILGATSDTQSFTSGAATSAELRSALPDVFQTSSIATTAPGQTLSGNHRLNFESFGFSVFKEVQLPVTRINGMFGFQAIDIDHLVNASVTDGAGAVLQTLNSRSDMRAFGPRINVEYFRPVGHTRLEFLTRFGGALLFGKRDQRIFGQDTLQRVDTDEIVTTLGFLTALQIKQRIGENRAVFGRIGYMNESFNSGGSGFLPQDDFGLRGFTILVGVNR